MAPGKWLVAAALILPAAAQAQPAGERGWYVGISLGSATAKFDREVSEVTGATASSVSSDDKSGYGKIYVGYQVLPWFAVEGGFSNLGTYSTTRNVTAPASGSLTANVETRGIHIDAVFLARTQTNFTPFGRIGIVATNTRIEYSTTGAVTLQPGVDTVHDQGDGFLKLGIGVDYAFTPNLSARVELEHMGAGRKTSRSPDEDINVYRSIGAFSLGLAYRF
jgi:OmpA-OmpF porin, OOP family